MELRESVADTGDQDHLGVILVVKSLGLRIRILVLEPLPSRGATGSLNTAQAPHEDHRVVDEGVALSCQKGRIGKRERRISGARIMEVVVLRKSGRL